MTEVREYLVHCSATPSLELRELIAAVFGSRKLPFSYVQDHEDLDLANFLDFKINKWECNERWRCIQPQEPWLRLEFLRDDVLRDALDSGLVDLPPALDFEPRTSVLVRLDGSQIVPVDLSVLVLFVSSLCKFFQGSAFTNGRPVSIEGLVGDLDVHAARLDDLLAN